MIDDHGRLDHGRDEHSLFRSTGERVQGSFRCAGCGYGVARVRTLPRCPMCGGDDWEDDAVSALLRARLPLWHR